MTGRIADNRSDLVGKESPNTRAGNRVQGQWVTPTIPRAIAEAVSGTETILLCLAGDRIRRPKAGEGKVKSVWRLWFSRPELPYSSRRESGLCPALPGARAAIAGCGRKVRSLDFASNGGAREMIIAPTRPACGSARVQNSAYSYTQKPPPFGGGFIKVVILQ